MNVVGIDPGPVVGIALFRLERLGLQPLPPPRLASAEALQVTPGLLHAVLEALSADAVAMERFVVGPRAGRSGTPTAGAAAREIVALVQSWAEDEYVQYHARAAAEVKPWATDARLAAAGLLEPTKGMRHARDAGRHALFCAVKDYGLPDPLSSKAGAR